MRQESVYIDKDWLFNQYIVLKKGAYEIAEEAGCSKNTIYNRLRKFKIPIRTKSEIQIGVLNNQWKGDSVGYHALHNYIRNHKPKPQFCEICGKSGKLDCANISGEYKRDLNDWQYICRSCHCLSDDRNKNKN